MPTTTKSTLMPLNGSATSSPPDTSRRETLTSDQSSMFDPTTCGPIVGADAISLPGSADGPTLSDSPDGATTDLFGQAVAPVSLSAQPDRARRPMTNATYGLRGFLSSASATLQSSLESRLRRQLDGAGSTLFSLIWRRKATPAGRPYFQLVASAHPTSETDSGSWPTPMDQQANGEPEAFLERKRRSVARGNSMGCSLTDLQMVAKLASWPTPMAGTPAQKGYNEAGNNDYSRKVVELAYPKGAGS